MADRRPTLLPLAVGALALAGVFVLFHSILEPVQTDGCNTTLIPSTFASALGPAHLAAAIVVAACIWAMSGPRPDATTRWGLGIVVGYALACAAVPGLFTPVGLVAIFTAPMLGPLVVLALIISALLGRSHAQTARGLLWAGLLLGLPASAADAWLSGVSVFCF